MTTLERLRAGDRRALARLISRIEARQPEARALVAELASGARPGACIGITGPPGSGKSTLIDALIAHWRGQGRSVAALAVDPSSAISGGAALGDRVRMMRHYADPDVFVRSMASRGELGGLAAAAAETVATLAALFDVTLIETVGVGQSEVDIARLADVVVVLQVAGLGDHIQMLKAGILEVADLIAVTRADLPGAGALATQLRAHLGDDEPETLTVSATTGEGIADLVETVERLARRRTQPAAAASVDARDRLASEEVWLREAVALEARRRLAGAPLLRETARRVSSGEMTREAAVTLLWQNLHLFNSSRDMS